MPAVAPRPPEDLYVPRYGHRFPPLAVGRKWVRVPDWEIERQILSRYDEIKHRFPDLLPWTEHFKKFVSIIWGRPEVKYPFFWNPYADRMLEEAYSRRLLGISGHASSGKSQFGAIWGIANFLIHPCTTKVIYTSTTLVESRMRIWGVVEKYWEEARLYLETPFLPMPGKLVSSQGKIVGMTSGKADDLTGLNLVPGGKGSDDATKIGFKAGKLILIADELPDLTHKIYESATNLKVNKGFQMIGIGNFKSLFDPFGIFGEPKGGWESVNEEMLGWETKVGGYCIRFDGEKAPNVVARKELYPGLLTLDYLKELKEEHGERSPGYYRMVKSFPCPTGDVEAIYTEIELQKNGALQKNAAWYDRPIPLAFLDPSFSKGGDRAAAAFGLLGYARHPVTGAKMHFLEKTDTVDLMMKVNARHPTKDRNEQLADLFIEECVKRNVAVPDRGADTTGGGDPFSTVLAMRMGAGMCKVSFAGAASDKPVSATSKKKGKDRFVNRVSELWYIGKDFVAAGQLRGVDATTAMEMCARTFKDVKERVLVEPKDDMKKRTNGRSPDFADALMGLIEVARERHGFTPAAKALNIPQAARDQMTPVQLAVEAMWSPPAPASRYRETLTLGTFDGSGWDE